MGALPTVAMGLVIVFLDAGDDGLDRVADPVGWILVLLGLSPLKEHLAGHRGLVVTAWICFVVSGGSSASRRSRSASSSPTRRCSGSADWARTGRDWARTGRD